MNVGSKDSAHASAISAIPKRFLTEMFHAEKYQKEYQNSRKELLTEYTLKVPIAVRSEDSAHASALLAIQQKVSHARVSKRSRNNERSFTTPLRSCAQDDKARETICGSSLTPSGLRSEFAYSEHSPAGVSEESPSQVSALSS